MVKSTRLLKTSSGRTSFEKALLILFHVNTHLMLRNLHRLPAFSMLILVCSFPACKKYYIEHRPVADAGPADTITLPRDSATLTGSGSSPDGRTVGFSWTELSGPATATIVSPNTPSTAVKGLDSAGVYTFLLTVTDDRGISNSDTTTVLVNASPYHTLVLQPNNNPDELRLGLINYSSPAAVDTSGPTTGSFYAELGQTDGHAYLIRGLIRFDLSSVPSTATIDSARLVLCLNPTPGPGVGDGIHSTSGQNLNLVMGRVTGNWAADTTNFLNLPPATGAAPILPGTPPYTTWIFDVTSMVSSMVSTNTNYGFLMKMPAEGFTNPDDPLPHDVIFVASHNPNYPDKHPKLIVYYH
jgi:hypothetical protein